MCSGIRSPGGIAFNAAGDAFYTDNQGTWNGTSGLKHLKPHGFMGNPNSLKWYDRAPNMGRVRRSRQMETRDAWFSTPRAFHNSCRRQCSFRTKNGQSASAILLDGSNGKFGPFASQLFVADYTLSTIMRVDLEQVNGVYQGACFPFRQGFKTGLIGGTLTESGHVFVGGSNRGWPVRGLSPSALQRLDWTGRVPFEVREMRARPDGFELKFTAPVDARARKTRSVTRSKPTRIIITPGTAALRSSKPRSASNPRAQAPTV